MSNPADAAKLISRMEAASLAAHFDSFDKDARWKPDSADQDDPFSEDKVTFDPSKGAKFDTGKQSWYPLPLEILKPLADVCVFGATKYAVHNMLQPFDNADQRFYDAILRHMEACQMDPLAKDEDSKCYHLAAVAFSALMRLYHCRKEKGEL